MAIWMEHISKQHIRRPYEYFAKDHLGNVRVVFSPNGRSAMRVQEDHYYPFGMPMPYTHYASSSSTPNRLLYNSKELLNYLPGLRWYDYGGRCYDPEKPGWWNIDQYAEKYYSWSPYVYCLNNPLRYVDPDGKVVKPAPGSSTEFKGQILSAVNYLNDNGAGAYYGMMVRSDQTFYIQQTNGNSYFDPNSNTVYWNPTRAYLTNTGYELSPAEVLSHESDHAQQSANNPEQLNKDRNTPDKQYSNKEEKRVITGSEQNVAKKLGKLKPGEKTREDHKAAYIYETTGPTSTDDPNAVVITPQSSTNNSSNTSSQTNNANQKNVQNKKKYPQ